MREGTAVVHAIALTAADYHALASDGVALVWSPRSNVSLYGDTAQVPLSHRLGMLIALGSDWMLSGSMNLLRELRCADELNQTHLGGYFDDRALWLMVTHHAAMALGRDDMLGRLAPGLVGDIAIFDGRRRGGYRAVIDAEPADVALVLRGGQPLYGDASVVAALEESCETLDVCTLPKRVCAQPQTGVSLSQVLGSAPYPAFACGAPAGEPSCLPVRTVSVDGSSVYDAAAAQQDDGDGIPSALDNCPEVFNPIRPLDQGQQADADADGQGEACDPCPLDANTSDCPAPDPLDRDGDGITAALDNCPAAANPDQQDADADGRGDACDACSAANPGPTPCALAIYDPSAASAAAS
jgi:hypothetical protein